MNTFIVTVVVFVALYLLGFAYVILSERLQQRKVAAQFIESWRQNSYIADDVYNYDNEDQLIRVEFPSGNNKRVFNITADGEISSSFTWKNTKITKTMKPTRYVRKTLTEYTKQIATMHKLNNFGTSDSDANTGWASQ